MTDSNSLESIIDDITAKSTMRLEVKVFGHIFKLESPDPVKEAKLSEKADRGEFTMEEQQIKTVALCLRGVDDKDFSDTEKVGDQLREDYLEGFIRKFNNATLIGSLYVATGELKKQEIESVIKNVESEGLKTFYDKLKADTENLKKEALDNKESEEKDGLPKEEEKSK